MILSIIIPVYNVEAYIEECLNSVINQTASKNDYEVIVINDGSSDKSLSIVENTDWKNTKYIVKKMLV